MFWLGWTRGGDPEQDSATVQYEPPENLTPAECGALLDNAVALRCIAATIVDLSVKGYLAIEPSANNKLPGQTDNRDYVFHLIKPPSEWNSLKAHEHAVLGRYFPPYEPAAHASGCTVTPAKSSREFRPRRLFSGLQVISMAKVQAMWKANPRLRALTEAKDEARPEVRGFAIFLARVEKDHIERMEKSPELFEKYLPYAMALRVENRWAQAFASIAVQQPHWDRGRSGHFFSVDLVNDLSVMSNQTGHAMTPTDGAASESEGNPVTAVLAVEHA